MLLSCNSTFVFCLLFIKFSPTFPNFESTSHPRKSDSPPVSELGSLPLTDIALTPSTSSRPSRPHSAMAPSRRTASAGAAAASASASASARPQSAASSSQLRLQSQGVPGIWSRYAMITDNTITLTTHNSRWPSVLHVWFWAVAPKLQPAKDTSACTTCGDVVSHS